MKKRMFLFSGTDISVAHIEHKAQGETVTVETGHICMAGDVQTLREAAAPGYFATAYYRDVWFAGCEEPKRFASTRKEDLELEEFEPLGDRI